jgi:hypothetical protein
VRVRLLFVSALAVGLPASSVHGEALKGPCRTRRGVGMLVSPARPIPGQPMRVVVVAERALPGAKLLGKGPGGELVLEPRHRSGPPHFWFAELKQPRSGSYRFALVDGGGKAAACGRALARKSRKGPGAAGGGRNNNVTLPDDVWWKTRRSWNRVRENLYSAWIEKLFDAPASERPTWSPLHQVLRDPRRNFLHNHLGAKEDGPGRGAVVVKPDCADLPYFLRAYFAWKMRLPFGHRQCSRGSSRRAPRCDALQANDTTPLTKKGETRASRFSTYLRRRVSYVHSGAGSTGPDDDETDLYPLALKRSVIRPGTVYVDPAGHLLVIAKWVPQRGRRSGQLFAIESQPDLTVGRKRFWRGAFLFNPGLKGPAGGFKAFRPLVKKDGKIVALTNDEIRKSPAYHNHSDEQYRLTKDGFYDRVDRMINPRPLSPADAYREQLVALFELIQKRIDSVHTGEDYMREHGYKTIKMPVGPRIFQTTGPWEDYSTPARDFRLQVAMNQVLTFPSKVTAQPDRFALPAGKSAAAVARELEKLRRTIAKQKTVSYKRSDGSRWTLTMADVLDRRVDLEMAYNPNDCIEIRWGAKGKELATCKRHAPEEQRRRMTEYRKWFKDRVRPPIR